MFRLFSNEKDIAAAGSDETMKKSNNTLLLALVLSVLPINGFAYNATGNEDRCEELGANCICSEPLNTSTLVKQGSFSLNPADTTGKQCTTSEGGAIEANNGTADATSRVIADNNATVMAALPSAHTFSHFVRGQDGVSGASPQGVFFIGQEEIPADKFVKRVAVRWYVYHTPDYDFKNEGSCVNSKFSMMGNNAKFGGSGLIGDVFAEKGNGVLHVYNGWTGMTYDKGAKSGGDCCYVGPPVNEGARVPLSTWKGNWLRFEYVMTNRAGGASPNGFTYKIYVKNVTTGTPEQKVVDSTIYDSSAGKSTGFLGADDLTPSAIVDYFLSNNYRQGTCNGYRAISHYMLAGWDTDEGQRIGSAKEVEGVSGDTGSLDTPLPDTWSFDGKIMQ